MNSQLIKVATVFVLSLCALSSQCAAGNSVVADASRSDTDRRWSPRAGSPFEVDTQLRPWTIRDEGMDSILDVVQSMAGVNSIYMVVVMHQEHRPYQAPKFPHNPVRPSFEAEDSRVSFFPDFSRYGKIKPLLSDYPWIRQTDWLKLMVDACRARGMGTGAEVSHYPIPKELLRRHPEWQQRDIHGRGVPTRFCPNNPETREYLIALFGDLAAHYDLDYIQTCQYLFNGKDIDEGGTCFCRHCIRQARAWGFDLERAIPILKADKNAQPWRNQWLAFRRRSTTEIYRLLSEEIRRLNPKCHLRYNDTLAFGRRDNRDFGVYLDDMAPYLGSVVNQDHQEQFGRPNEDFAWRKRWLALNRKLIGPDKPLLCGIATRMKATPELIRRGIRVALRHPARINGLALKHYDGASFGLMRAFKQGMIENGIQGLAPILGQEAEAMNLEGYAVLPEELAEDFGIYTKDRGRASYVFDGPSGTYDVRLTYFDSKGGHSVVTLLVAGTEKARFRMDEDTDCWRARVFPDITVKTGDRIELLGQAHGQDQAILEFIEFLPKTPTNPARGMR